LASTMSMLDSSACGRTAIAGTSSAAAPACSLRSPAARKASTAEPKPNQPGSVSRHWPQLKLQGTARRSSMFCGGLARRRARADVQFGDLADRRGAEEVVGEAGRLVHQRRGRPSCSPATAPRPPAGRPWARLGRLQQRGLQRGRHQRLQVAPADLGVGVLGGDHLALLGQADLAAHGARRLRQDGLVAGPPPRPTVPPRPWNRRSWMLCAWRARRTASPARSRRGTAPSCW
jgi:hypothetical protein